MNYSINKNPLVINWMISGKCNMPCKFCYGYFNSTELSSNEKFYILEQIIKYKIPKLTLTGGEPLLDKDILYLLKISFKNDIFTSLHTNGILLDDKYIENIKKYIGRISLPIDGSNDKMNLQMRGIDNYYSLIIEKLNTLKKEKISFSVKTVASKKNIDDIPKMIPLIKELDPIVWLITEFKPLRRGNLNKHDFSLNSNDFNNLKFKLSNLPINISLFSNNDLSSHPHFLIDSKADVYTNGVQNDIYIGNILNESIPYLWSKIIKVNNLTESYYSHSRISVNENY